MGTYVMAIKGKGVELNGVIWNTQAPSLSEAKEYFVKLKNLSEQQFDQLFIVTEIQKETVAPEQRIFERNPDTGEIRSRRKGDYGAERRER